MPKLAPISVHDLGEYLREQRQAAQLSLRQLSEVAGISNPYISQIERGRKKPSAEILYVRAGILDEGTDDAGVRPVNVTDAVLADPRLSERQRAVLMDVYVSFVGEPATGKASASKSTKTTRPAKARHAPTPAQKPGTPAHPEITQKEKQS